MDRSSHYLFAVSIFLLYGYIFHVLFYWLEGHNSILREINLLKETPKRIYCAIFGHKLDYVQSWYDGEWDAFCIRCNNEGNFDSLKKIPYPFAWYIHDKINMIICTFNLKAKIDNE